MRLEKKEYDVFYFRQRPTSPVQASFIATSADIADWASVPVKRSSDLKKFQRPVIPSHVDEIRNFFKKYNENCSPSAIVIGFQYPVVITDESGVVVHLSEVRAGEIKKGRLQISFPNPHAADDGELRELVGYLIQSELKVVRERLEELTESMSADSGGDISDVDVDEDDGVLVDNGNDEYPDSEDLEVEQSAGAHAQSSADENGNGEDASYDNGSSTEDPLTAQRKRLEALEGLDVQSMSDEDLHEMCEALLDLHKPGLIIDGQHRVAGTKTDNVPFTVAALPTASWPELAFQFIVLNKSAKKVQDSLLINIVGNSLDEEELSEIEKRLNDSGVPVPLYQGVMRLHDDPASPFYQRLRFGIEDERGIIDAAAAKTKIVNFWFNCQLYEMISHLIPGKTKTEKIQHWKGNGLWWDYLREFWSSARTRYEPHSSLWTDELQSDRKTPVSKLMRVTIIALTQKTIISYMIKAGRGQIKNDIKQETSWKTLYPDLAAFRTACDFYFDRLKPDFFQDWGSQAKGFDGSKAIKNAYQEAIISIVSGEKTIGQLKSPGDPTKTHLLYRA